MPVVAEVELVQPALPEQSVGVISPIVEVGDVIPEAPTLPPPLVENIVPVVEDVEMLAPIILEETVCGSSEILTLPAIEELLPCEEVELVEPVMLEEPSDVWSLIAELDEIILESSTIPSPLIEETEQVEPIPLEKTVSALSATTEITEIIPNAPTLPSLPIEDIAPAIEEVEIVKQEILQKTVGVIFETTNLTAVENFVPCEEMELVKPVIFKEPVGVLSPITKNEPIIPDAPTLSPISIENVDLFTKDILLQKPDMLEELIKMFPEFDGGITKASTLTSLFIEEIDSKDPIMLKDYADAFASDPETIILDEQIPVGEEILIDPCTGMKEPAYYMSSTSEIFTIPGAPKISFSEAPCALVENTYLEYIDSPKPTIITEPVLESDKAEYFISEQFPLINSEEGNKDVIMGDSGKMFLNQQRTRLEINKEPSVANSTALDKVSQDNSYHITEHPNFVPVPSNNQEVFNYEPIISTLSIPKPKSLNNMLIKGRRYRFRTNPYPNLPLKEQSEHHNKVILSTPYAHDIVKNRISPNRSIKKPVFQT